MYLIAILCLIGLAFFVYRRKSNRSKMVEKTEEIIALATTVNYGDMLTNWELEHIKKEICPDCKGSNGFYEGPCGGLSVNVKCANPACGSKFNIMGPLGVERISKPSPEKQKIH